MAGKIMPFCLSRGEIAEQGFGGSADYLIHQNLYFIYLALTTSHHCAFSHPHQNIKLLLYLL